MVVAQVPVWVVHSSATVGPGAPGHSSGNPSTALSPHKRGRSSSEEDPHHRSEQRAIESLSLLEGLGGTQKCAIYSLDVHPEGKKFATGGGDGRVRIWNAGALFARHPRAGASSSRAPKGARYKEGGAYESSGESSGAEESFHSHATSAPADEGSGSDSSVGGGDEEVVRDLSSLVRRKKDGSNNNNNSNSNNAPTPNSKSGDPAKNGGTTTHASPSQKPASHANHHHHSNHNHHHHRLLCTLSAHTGSSVLAVRFSTNGQYLASAGDDAAVCIYSPNAHTGGNLDTNVEHWTRIKLCRGHALDVVGLAWAPDDSHLVSCSLDSNAPIIVWKLTDLASNHHQPTHSNVLVNPYKILGKGIHTSTVKGVTFDPAGTYLASSGDDPSVCVWRAHDDWGLEKRIDADSGIFRKWREQDSQSLSSQSLFRRLSWSTDGTYICSTNAVVKNKHVASTIAREGWAVSNAKSTASGAANLVGHKQPVVACRHCPFLLDARPRGENGDTAAEGDEPEYATLLALGDKRGFVTIWSTKQSRPVFKIQCSETRCTVTDLAWGKFQKDIMLLVSMLDGQVVALKLGVPDELGNLLRPEEQSRVFQLRYGIDLNDTDMGRRRLFVGENSGPKLIENALQYFLEDQEEGDNDDESNDVDKRSGDVEDRGANRNISASEVKANQLESRSKGGKKRIQPLLMAVDSAPAKRPKTVDTTAAEKEKAAKKKVDTVEGAMELAEKAANGAEEAVASQKTSNKTRTESVGETSTTGTRDPSPHPAQNQVVPTFSGVQSASPQIPHSTDRIHSVDLPVGFTDQEDPNKFVADCTNSIQVPQGSKGSAVPCTTLAISRSGMKTWKDVLPGTSCSAIAASKMLLAVGTTDGCVYLYGTSPTLGWTSGTAFRSHPPFISGRPIVSLQLHDVAPSGSDTNGVEMLLVSADGSFGVYSLVPELKVVYKGSIIPPMSHMLLASDVSNEMRLPRLARIQLTDTNRLFLLLSLHTSHSRQSHDDSRARGTNNSASNAGGSLQAFVYEKASELWMRLADSRFVLSDFYSTLPNLSKSKKAAIGVLSKLDDSVRLGAASSTLMSSRRGVGLASSTADRVYQQSGSSENDMTTRSHCEDRLACSVVLKSQKEFEYWLAMYARTLAMAGNETSLRMLVDLLNCSRGPADDGRENYQGHCWWLSEAPKILGLERTRLIKSVVIPEMSKNRQLQRITNEIAIEVENLS